MITLTLGNFTFARGELPESIAFGSSQQLHVHTLVGGARVIDAMGMAPLRPSWSGWFTGPQALARARRLKQLAEAGEPLPLSWGEFAYTVLISEFSAEFRSGPSLPYTITLEVLLDQGAASPAAAPPGLVQMLAQDLGSALANAASIDNPGVTSAMMAVSSAVAAQGSAPLTPSAIRLLLPPIAAAQAVAGQLSAAAASRIAALVPLATPAAAPAGPAALGAFGAGLAQAASATGSAGLLASTIQTLGRMSANLAAAAGTGGTGGGATITTGSTDLYHLAASAYGDARGWTLIAQANALTDPAITGIATLVIPAADGATLTGVLDA